MRFLTSLTILLGLFVPATAEVVYTPANISIPVGGAYSFDLNYDGIADFTLRSHLLQSYCQFGDGYDWSLTIDPAAGNAVVAESGSDASALLQGASIDSTQPFSPETARMTELDWGSCGRGSYGQWLNTSNRYLGLQLRLPGSVGVHYGWAKVAVVAYVDRYGHLQASTVLQAFAYETIVGREIFAGQMTE